MTSAGKFSALESIASKVESVHSRNSSSAALSNAKSAAEGLKKKLGAEKSDPEGHPAGSDTQPLHEPKAAPEDHKGPETEEPGSSSTAVKGGSSPKNEAKDGDGDKSQGNDGKDKGNKKDDTNDKEDKKPEDTNKSKNPDDSKGKDTKGDGDNAEDKAITKDSDNPDKKGNHKDEGDDVPKNLGVDDFLASPPEKASSFEERKRNWEAKAKAYTTKTVLSKFEVDPPESFQRKR